jgi:hypothetical protein
VIVKRESGKSGNRRRYGSIMLVGEHGHVVPFRRFKAVILSVITLVVLGLSSAAVFGGLYFHKTRQLVQLLADFNGLQSRYDHLKDESDRPGLLLQASPIHEL